MQVISTVDELINVWTFAAKKAPMYFQTGIKSPPPPQGIWWPIRAGKVPLDLQDWEYSPSVYVFIASLLCYAKCEVEGT
jgi:hypothetical protein